MVPGVRRGPLRRAFLVPALPWVVWWQHHLSRPVPCLWLAYYFAGIAVLGVLWIIPWVIINKATPDKHPWFTEKERQHILDGIKKKPYGITGKVYSWTELLQFRNTWGILTFPFFYRSRVVAFCYLAAYFSQRAISFRYQAGGRLCLGALSLCCHRRFVGRILFFGADP
jgi:hypothetical protein